MVWPALILFNIAWNYTTLFNTAWHCTRSLDIIHCTRIYIEDFTQWMQEHERELTSHKKIFALPLFEIVQGCVTLYVWDAEMNSWRIAEMGRGRTKLKELNWDNDN